MKKAVAEGDLVEAIGNWKAGDMVVRRATDETQDGAPLQIATKAKQAALEGGRKDESP